MKHLIVILVALSSYGCATRQTIMINQCPGDGSLPVQFAGDFTPIVDEALLTAAQGEPGKGGLCSGQVYQSKVASTVVLYRAWNSTNPNSKFGSWWAFQQPAGSVARYREDYEICYQWSPLDMMVRCTLKPDTKVVVGPGQSAECSQYLNYPASEAKQIYIENASAAMLDCAVYKGEFRWKEVAQ